MCTKNVFIFILKLISNVPNRSWTFHSIDAKYCDWMIVRGAIRTPLKMTLRRRIRLAMHHVVTHLYYYPSDNTTFDLQTELAFIRMRVKFYFNTDFEEMATILSCNYGP